MKKELRIHGRIMLSVICIYLITGIVNIFSQSLPAGAVDGINYIDNNTVILVLTAPNKGSAYVTGTFNSWGQTNMNKTPDGIKFWVQLNGLTSGQEYIYQYVVDGIRVADPYAEKILDPWNDQYITSTTYPGLISYTDVTKGIASVFQTAQTEYNWQVPSFTAPLKHQLVIYELLIRDFTAQHSYQSVIDSMQYLKKLGINAIELMPVNEFDGNNSWGYNPSFYFAPDKYYGPKAKLQQLIDVAHQNGIAVILDMVYNHSMNSSPLAQLYWNSTLSRPASNNPWYNETAPHTTIGWGNDFNHESQYTRDFFDRVNKHWLTKYKIDGFRFDFTKGWTQTYSTSDPYGYDQSRINNIERMASQIWQVKSNAYVILEHWSDDAEENVLTNYGCLTWRRVDSQYKEAMMGWQLTNSASIFSSAQTDAKVVFMESHDEERQMWMCKQWGNVNGSYNTKETNTALDRMALGAAFLYIVPGPKMIWMFGEQGYDYSINNCPDGTINTTCRTSEKPLVWTSYMQDQNRKDLYNAISKLLKLRMENQAFTLGYYEADNDGDGYVNSGIGPVRQIRFKHSTMDVVIMANFGVTGANINPWFTKTGTWYNYFGNYTYNYTGQTQYWLAPGQWELYTSVNIASPVPVTSVSVSPSSATINIGSTQQLTATVLPANATNKSVTWSSSNTAVATVNASGLVSGVSAGTTNITVTTVDGGKTATSSINVTAVPVTSVSVNPTTATISVGNTQQLTATVLPANATNKSVTWSSNNSAIATVNSSGLVTGVTAGSATITVTTVDGNKTATSSITVTTNSTTYYRIKNRWQTTTYLKDINDGKVSYGTNPSSTDYAYQWSKEVVDATYYRLKNRATGLYMNNENLQNYVQCTTIQSTWWSAMWKDEDAGSGWLRIRNKYQTGDMIHIENLLGYAQRTGGQTSWWSAMWQLETVTTAKAAESSDEFGTDRINDNLDLNFYPNPVKSGQMLNILLTGQSENETPILAIYSLTGALMIKQPVDVSGQVEINLQKGIYILTVQNKQVSINRKLMVN